MNWYTYLFAPDTYKEFLETDRKNAGVRKRQQQAAARVQPGDVLVCYLTKISRWFGLLEVVGERPYHDPQEDPFPVRLRVKPLVLLEDVEHGLPIRNPEIWGALSFTRDANPASGQWTGKLRGSLVPLDGADGSLLDRLLRRQDRERRAHPLTDDDRRKMASLRVRRPEADVAVSAPEPDSEPDPDGIHDGDGARTSHQVQADLARLGADLGLDVWTPRNDRERVLAALGRSDVRLLDRLPLNYDEATLRTIENIDVLWLRRRSIVRAFEVEHTTAIYSGILRMADLLALQPNMEIRLHIVAPPERREKVFEELRRPVFSLLERGPLAELCTYLSYEGLDELTSLSNLHHMRDSVIDEYAEKPDELQPRAPVRPTAGATSPAPSRTRLQPRCSSPADAAPAVPGGRDGGRQDRESRGYPPALGRRLVRRTCSPRSGDVSWQPGGRLPGRWREGSGWFRSPGTSWRGSRIPPGLKGSR